MYVEKHDLTIKTIPDFISTVKRENTGLLIVNENYKPEDFDPEMHTGFDLRARKEVKVDFPKIVPTGVKIAFPKYTWLSIVPKSGLSYKTQLRIPNAPETVEASYRDEVGVILEVVNTLSFLVEEKMKVAQAIFCVSALGIHEYPQGLKMAVIGSWDNPEVLDSIRKDEKIEIYNISKDAWDYLWENWHKIFNSKRGLGGYGSTGLK